MYAALAGTDSGVTDVVLYDTDAARLDVMASVLSSSVEDIRALERSDIPPPGGGPPVTVTTELDVALEGADFVFSAVRVGGLRPGCRTSGSPSTSVCWARRRPAPAGSPTGCAPSRSPGGSPNGSAPSHRTRVINFTNPAGLVTEAMRSVLGDRVVGICDTPITMAKRAARLLGVDPHTRWTSTTSG